MNLNEWFFLVLQRQRKSTDDEKRTSLPFTLHHLSSVSCVATVKFVDILFVLFFGVVAF